MTVPANVTCLTPFLRRLREQDQAAIDAENARIDKTHALLVATRKLTALVKTAKRVNGDGPQAPATRELITLALRAQVGVVRELDKLRGRE